MTKLLLKFKGGPGSGNFDHKGRKGFVGGSASSATGSPYSAASEAAFDKTFGKGSHAKLSAQDQADWRRGVLSVEDFETKLNKKATTTGDYTITSPMIGKISVPKIDVANAKKLNRIAVANQDDPNLEAYFPVKRDKDGILYAVTDITPDAKWMKPSQVGQYEEDFLWLSDANAYVFVGHTNAWNG